MTSSRSEPWTEKETDVLWGAERTAGAICILHRGCALRDWLVVSGKARGTMWNDDRADGDDLEQVVIDEKPATFEAYFLDWLDWAEKKAASRADKA